MRVFARIAWIGMLGISVAIGATACGESPQTSHPGTGIVRDVDPSGRKITLDHEEIPGLMKGMTMTFNVSPDVRLEQIAPGAEVDFRVRDEGGVYTVTEIRLARS